MKKLITITAIMAGFSLGAAAQQNDFFDIKKYLQEKHKKKNMLSQKLPLTTPQIKIYNLSPAPLTSILSKRTFSHHSYKGDKIYLLGIDNMPCVSAEVKKFQLMPNVYNNLPNADISKRSITGAIPNVINPIN